jgi:aminotransferase EvaB
MIGVWDYLEELGAERTEIMDAIEGVLNSGTLVLGDQVKGFEAEFAKYCDSKEGIGVNSGTDAIFLGLKALGIGAGDEVITVANTAVPTVSAIEATGAIARFVDIESDTYLMNVDKLSDVINEKTKCIIPVHLFGQCVDMTKLRKIADQHSLHVLEDCAQAHGAKHHGAIAGSMSDISAFSFYPTKILGAYGDAGLIVTSSDELAAKCRRLRFYGMEQQYLAIEYGYNSRLDELQAAILRAKFKHLDEYISARRGHAEVYDRALAGSNFVTPAVRSANFHSYYLYVCRHPRRDEVLEFLKEHGVNLNVSYRWPIHTMSGYAHLGYKAGDLPNTEAAAKEIFSLPMYPALSQDKLSTTIESLLKAQEKFS